MARHADHSESRGIVVLQEDDLKRIIADCVASALRESVVPATPGEELPRFLSRRAAARLLGISTRTLDRAISAGLFETTKRGNRRLISLDELERWARDQHER